MMRSQKVSECTQQRNHKDEEEAGCLPRGQWQHRHHYSPKTEARKKTLSEDLWKHVCGRTKTMWPGKSTSLLRVAQRHIATGHKGKCMGSSGAWKQKRWRNKATKFRPLIKNVVTRGGRRRRGHTHCRSVSPRSPKPTLRFFRESD